MDEKKHLSRQMRGMNNGKKGKNQSWTFFVWLCELRPSGGTKIAKKIKYCLNEKKYLYRFLEDGKIPLDNNRAENAIHPFGVERKNW